MTQEHDQQRVVAERYFLRRELGRGGMGVVWLAEDRTIGRSVAIKELLLPPGIPPTERAMFEERVLREARTAGRLSDPGIVTVFDVVQEHGHTFIVMELINAENLSDVVRAHGPMPTDQVLNVAAQVLVALQTAHAAGVVHRDVKPSNVMIGTNGRVKLTDFGIAQSTEDPRLTTSGMLVGSPTYISPERLLGGDASPASDLWALGATLFFAAEGYGAFDRQNTAAAIQAILNERVQLRIVPRGPLADLILGLLEPDPNRRVDAGQAHYLIDQARNQPPPRPVAGTAVLPTVNNPQSGPQPVVHYTPQPSSSPRGTQVLPARKGKKALLIAAAAVVLAGAVVAILAVAGVFDSSRSGDSASSPAGGSTSRSTRGSTGDSAGGATKNNSTASEGHAAPAPTGRPGRTRAVTFGQGGEITSDEFTDSVGIGCYEGSSKATIKETACDQPHIIEIVNGVDLKGDYEAYPGAEAATKAAEEGCRKIFDTMMNINIPVSFGAMVPTEDAWNKGKHKGWCAAYAPGNNRLSVSVAGN